MVLVLILKLLVMINKPVRIQYVRNQTDNLSSLMDNAKTVHNTLTLRIRELVFQIKINVVTAKSWMSMENVFLKVVVLKIVVIKVVVLKIVEVKLVVVKVVVRVKVLLVKVRKKMMVH